MKGTRPLSSHGVGAGRQGSSEITSCVFVRCPFPSQKRPAKMSQKLRKLEESKGPLKKETIVHLSKQAISV